MAEAIIPLIVIDPLGFVQLLGDTVAPKEMLGVRFTVTLNVF